MRMRVSQTPDGRRAPLTLKRQRITCYSAPLKHCNLMKTCGGSRGAKITGFHSSVERKSEFNWAVIGITSNYITAISPNGILKMDSLCQRCALISLSLLFAWWLVVLLHSKKAPGFSSQLGRGFLCGVGTFSPRLCGFPPGAPVSPTIIKYTSRSVPSKPNALTKIWIWAQHGSCPLLLRSGWVKNEFHSVNMYVWPILHSNLY